MTANQFGDSAMIAGDAKKNVADDGPEKIAQTNTPCKINVPVQKEERDVDKEKCSANRNFDSPKPMEHHRHNDEDETKVDEAFKIAKTNEESVNERMNGLEISDSLESENRSAPEINKDEMNFHEAVRAGDAKYVAEMIARGAVQDLDEPDWNVTGDPPLLVAATNHCLPVLSILLENNCDPTVRSPRGETALHRAVLNGGPGNVIHFVEKLLNHGCPATVKEAGGGLTALHILTRQLSHTIISKSLCNSFDNALKTLDLLAKASPVNAKDHQGRSALHILASASIFDNNRRSEIEKIIRILLEAGANAALSNDRGETALHESLESGALKVASLLMPHTPTGLTSRYGETPLHVAARKNYAEMVEKLLEHGEDPSLQDAGGNTPLHVASARGYHQIVSFLVTSPLTELEKINNEGLTPLQVATESGFVKAVQLLLQAGADPSPTAINCLNTLRNRHPDISNLINHELTRRRQLAT